MPDFVHLHTHTEYSLLDGLSKCKALAQHAVDLGMKALAITDHGAMYGVVDFYKACKAVDIQPIIGFEAYMARKSRTSRQKSDGKPYHIVLLAQTQTGYQNLLALSSIAQLEGFYYKPRIDKEVLAKYSAGVIALSACVQGEIMQLLYARQPEQAREAVRWYQEVFPDRFYIELQTHELPDYDEAYRQIVELAREMHVPLVATNDIHYARKDQAEAHDILLCIGTSKTVNDPKRMRMTDPSYYMRSPQEMAELYPEIPEALANTVKIAEQCHVELQFAPPYHLPKFPVPAGKGTSQEYLRHLCDAGMRWRYGEDHDKAEYVERLEYELGIIHKMGFDDYFLIVWDLCIESKRLDIWWNVRGSGAGSVVAYTLNITLVDPFRNRLMFERFLNPDRVSMPDIDLDYPDDRREELIAYTKERYGAAQVSAIITFGTLGARAAIRDVGRALDIPLSEVNRIAQLIPSVPGKPVSIAQALETVPDLKAIYDDTPYIQRLMDAATQLEGVTRHASTHAAGILISDKPLVEYLPLSRPTKGAIEDSPVDRVSQWPMEIVDAMGMLKVDFLGLRTLTHMRKACQLIEAEYGRKLDLNTIPYERCPEDAAQDADVQKLYELLATGETTGVFQVEGCLSADTVIGHRTIKELYQEFIARPVESLSGRQRLKATSCYLDEGCWHRNIILNVIDSGIKQVYRLVDEQNRWIKATADHYFLTERGWVRLGDLRLDTDRILFKCDASRIRQLCIDCEEPLKSLQRRTRRCKRCASRLTANPSRPAVRAKISESKLGSVPWNKDLTAETAADTTWIQNLRKYNTSQRGISYEKRYGHEKAAQMKARLSELNSGKGNPMYGRPPKTTKTYTKAGYRADLGHYVRSTWEADLARVFRYQEIEYLYEPRTFELVTQNGKYITYTPDFYVPTLKQWFEVKGWMDPVSAEKIALFRQQYPDCELVVIDKTRFAEFQLQYRDLVEWECPQIPPNSEWVRIRKIELVGAEPTYDLQMRSPGNNFVANGFIVHNSGMRRVLREMRPERFQHIIAVLALYRPGPLENIPAYIRRMHGEEEVQYHHPILENILDDTYGIIVYQEQILQITVAMAGYKPGEADLLRKAVSKKITYLMEKHKKMFRVGSINNGIPAEVADRVWSDIEFFARYGFNRAHATDYAVITAQTAYLKAHYPLEFMTALMTTERHNIEKLGFLITDARRTDIVVQRPCINHSGVEFTIEHDDDTRYIRIGLGAIKNVGDEAMQVLVTAREAGGPFKSLDDFADRVDLRRLNRKTLECLTQAGALDDFGERPALLASVEAILGASAQIHNARDVGQFSLFGDTTRMTGGIQLPKSVPPILDRKLLDWEKELLGTYLSKHPLTATENELLKQDLINITVAQLETGAPGQQLTLVGMVQRLRRITTKKGAMMAFVTMEGTGGAVDLVVFPRIYERFKEMLVPEHILVVSGKLDARPGREEHPLLVDWFKSPEDLLRPVNNSPYAASGFGATDEATFDEAPWDAEPPTVICASPSVSNVRGNGDSPTRMNESVRNYAPNRAAMRGTRDLTLASNAGTVTASSSTVRGGAVRVGPPPLAKSSAYAPPPPLEEPLLSPTKLYITLHRSNNIAEDFKALAQLHRLLKAQTGQDQFFVMLEGGRQGRVELSFPNENTRYTPNLRERVELLVGHENLRIV